MTRFGEKISSWIKREPVPFFTFTLTIICIIIVIIWSLLNKPKKDKKNCKAGGTYISDIVIGTSNQRPTSNNACPEGYFPAEIKGENTNNINDSTGQGPFTQICYKYSNNICDNDVVVTDIKAKKLSGDFPDKIEDICTEAGYFAAMNYYPDDPNTDPKISRWGRFVHNIQGCDNVAICVKNDIYPKNVPIKNLIVNVDQNQTCPSDYIKGGDPIVSGCLSEPNSWNFCYSY